MPRAFRGVVVRLSGIPGDRHDGHSFGEALPLTVHEYRGAVRRGVPRDPNGAFRSEGQHLLRDHARVAVRPGRRDLYPHPYGDPSHHYC